MGRMKNMFTKQANPVNHYLLKQHSHKRFSIRFSAFEPSCKSCPPLLISRYEAKAMNRDLQDEQDEKHIHKTSQPR
jgi:hypothetical protein